MLAACICAVLALAAADGAAAREWNQAHGSDAADRRILVEPIEAEPRELWRAELECMGEPVAWGGVVFVAARDGRKRRLHALALETGEPLAKADLGSKAEQVELAVWQSTVVVVQPDQIRTFKHDRTKLRLGKRIKGDWRGSPVVYKGLLLQRGNGGRLNCVDLRAGRVLIWTYAGRGRPAIVPGGSGLALVATADYQSQSGYDGTYLTLRTVKLEGGDKPSFGNPEVKYLGMLSPEARATASSRTSVLAFGSSGEPSWLIRSELPLAAAGGGALSASISSPMRDGLCPISEPAAAYGGHVIGFSSDGALLKVDATGSYRRLVEEDALPHGARAGPATVAGDVLYLSNWAVQIQTSRVLWCLPELDSASALLPVADRRVVYVATDGSLVCLGAPAEPSEADGAEALAVSAAVSAGPPGSGDGVVLADGRRLAGAVERREDGAVSIGPRDGSRSTFGTRDLALVESGPNVELVGEEYPVFQAWWHSLSAQRVEALENLFERYAKIRQLADCERLLVEAAEYGMGEQRALELRQSLAGKAQNSAANADRQRSRVAGDEKGVRASLAESIVAASDWCAAHRLPGAATVLLARAEDLVPQYGAALSRVPRLVPEEFPLRSGSETGTLWLRWCEQILPAGATFAPNSHAWPESGVWSSGAICLRTENLTLYSRCKDPVVVGECLRNAEGTIRVLTELLPIEEIFQKHGSTREPLDVRIHANRRDYLAESTPDGFYARSWSAGYFSPDEKVSRFYVQGDEDRGDPLGRGLNKVLVHELTHHYISQRWLASGRRGRSGPDASRRNTRSTGTSCCAASGNDR